MKSRKLIKLSASAIGELKACPYRYYAKYILGIRKTEDTEALRVGSNWHEGQDVMTRKPGSVCVPCAKLAAADPDCPLCEGTGFLSDNLMESVMRVLNKAYAEIPNGMDQQKVDVERTILLYSLTGYEWFYGGDQVEVLARELKFSHPLIGPSGRALPNVCVDGVIDKLVRRGNRVAIMEHKSTSKPVDSDSSFWAHLNLDVQTTLYIEAAQRMQLAGELRDYGIKETDPLINTILYDAWHKPGIKPRNLSQADSKAFVESGEYMSGKFEVMHVSDLDPSVPIVYDVNMVRAEITPGAKAGTFAIRETPEMFGQRLLQDIVERSDFYFARRELSKTEPEMERFRREVLSIYRDIRGKIKSDSFFHNERQCEATYVCDYTDQCYNGVELDPDNPPDGFENIFDKKEKKTNA